MFGRALNISIYHPELTALNLIISILNESLAVAKVVVIDDINTDLQFTSADVVIIRPNFPLQDAGAAIRRLQRRLGQPKLVALLEVSEVENIPKLYRSGFTAYVWEGAPREAFEAAFRVAHQGGAYLSQELAQALFSSQKEDQHFLASIGLTAREKQVLRLIALNMSNKYIARKLELSVRTVETHRLNIRKKTGAGNWRELAIVAERLGLFGEDLSYSNPAESSAAPGFHEE